MNAEEYAERMDEFRENVMALIGAYSDALGDEDHTMPAPSDWVLIVAVDDLADMNKGVVNVVAAPAQWQHRSVGLCLMAADRFRGAVVA